jgi:hypothetical protein
MKAQARPYMAVVANGFVRRVGVGLAGPEWCSTPVGKKRNERERERRGACSLGALVNWVGAQKELDLG